MAEKNPYVELLTNTYPEGGIDKNLIEEIFLITLHKNGSQNKKSVLCLADIIAPDSNNHTTFSEEILGHMLFERLMLTDCKPYLVTGDCGDANEALELDVVIYLHRSFSMCNAIMENQPSKINDCKKIRKLILTNANTLMRQPELVQGQSISEQWLRLLLQSDEIDTQTMEFLVGVVQTVIAEENDIEAIGVLKSIFYGMLSELQKRVITANLINIKKNIFTALEYFVRDKRVSQLGEVLIDFSTPNASSNGNAYMDTLFGHLLCCSILPKNSIGPYEFFSELNMESQQTDASLWLLMSMHQNNIFYIIKQLLLLNATTKQKMLQWIGNCLAANSSRGHIWSNMNLTFGQLNPDTASDSFMIGLCAVLLRLCGPLCLPQMKILLVDPTYCAVSEENRQDKQVHMVKVTEETCLLPVEENEQRLMANKYNFVTELFYMTQKAFELSYRTCIDKHTRLTRELHNLQTAYQDVVSSDPNNDLAKNLLRMLKDQTQQYLCMRNCLMEPENDKFILKFFEATAIWLTEITLRTHEEYATSMEKCDFAPHTRNDRSLPRTFDLIPNYLKSIPENIIDNIVSYLNFSRQFPSGSFIEVYHSSHYALFKMILLFMGNAELVKNPHLRAKLAEAMEFFLPKQITGSVRTTFMTHVFDNHPDRMEVVQCLLKVFVSIEMTGQSVQFEQKFNYRRPMYAIIEYLWTKPEQVQCFKDLAIEAEQNMEAINPPLFLLFINLLINDAIFLLDESLSNLQQIRQLQDAQAKGEWDNLSQNERQQQLTNLHHLGMLARFDNILGRDTINTLKLLTTEIKSIFCHSSMVDRIAAMLNYFLLNLVGPKKEQFKVKDKKEFEFDPAQTVLEISHIYINLSESERFCLAVSQDGRSYSPQLFEYAENILIRIGGGQLIGEMSELAAKIKQIDTKFKADQEIIADAPDEYLDPIMSTLMTDPVILPSSKVTVDRSTIARHLLSDQTDPFNRAPLTMDKVIPNEQLKAEIEKWILDKRAANRSDAS